MILEGTKYLGFRQLEHFTSVRFYCFTALINPPKTRSPTTAVKPPRLSLSAIFFALLLVDGAPPQLHLSKLLASPARLRFTWQARFAKPLNNCSRASSLRHLLSRG